MKGESLGDTITALNAEREQLVRAAREFEKVLDQDDLPSEMIQSSIEELRPIRMRIHELDRLIRTALENDERE
jgi:hypothetical protein